MKWLVEDHSMESSVESRALTGTNSLVVDVVDCSLEVAKEIVQRMEEQSGKLEEV